MKLNNCFIDTETMGLYGPAVIGQFEFDYCTERHDDKPFIYDFWRQPAGLTRDLIEEVVQCRVIAHNLTFDWQKVTQFYNAVRRLIAEFGESARPIDHIDRFAEFTGRCIAWLTLGMVCVTFAVVILRYLFNTGSIALQEAISYLHAAVFMLGAAYTLKHDGHVRVDILYRKWSPETRAWLNLIGTLLLLFPVCVFIFSTSLDYVGASWSMREGSREAGGLNAVFLLKTVIPVMAFMLALQGCAMVAHSILIISGQDDRKTDDAGLDREL